jgi:hypothetical protein
VKARCSKRGAGRPRRGLALPLAVLLLAGAASARGHDLPGDPLDAMGGVSATPAKDLLPGAGDACQSAGPLPSPLGLADAVERALCNNPRTRQAWASVKAQAAAVGTGWSAYLPTLSGTRRGFRFLKDPLFMASTVFLKSPRRSMALCLMVCAALEHRIRQGSAQQHQAFPDQKGKPTERPTARWVFQSFMDIHLLTLPTRAEIVSNLKAHHRALLNLLGERHVAVYANSG